MREGHQVYHCFNCGFSCDFILGKPLSGKCRDFLSWCGVDEIDIQRWNLESIAQRDLVEDMTKLYQSIVVSFEHAEAPPGELIDGTNPDHFRFIEYLGKRGIDYADYPFMVDIYGEGRESNRVIIPFTHQGMLIGHTSRYLDDQLPKYMNVSQPGYVFGVDFQKDYWQQCILTEGIFDALSINGCALMHATISREQAAILSHLNRPIILVPDQDDSGLEICERALSLGYRISIPDWGPDVKDVNDAVVKYGRLTTLLSILECATNSRIKLEMARRKIAKRL